MALDRFIAGIEQTAVVVVVDAFATPTLFTLLLATGTTPLAVEQGLMKNIPKEKWSDAHHWLIWHGRKICKARKPACDICPLAPVCPSAEPLAGNDTKTK